MSLMNTAGGPRSRVTYALMMLGIGFMCFLFALLSVSGSPILIGLGVSMLAGPVLLFMPVTMVWIVLVVGFMFGILSASPQLAKIGWGVSVLSMLLMGPALINIMWSKKDRLPGFLVIAWIFMIFAVLESFAQWYSVGEFVAGYKRCFQAFGLMMALATLHFTPATFVRWRKFMLFVALMQLPFALFEMIVLVPMRHSSSSDATDVIAGTFGANLEGGSPNAVMVIFIFIAVAFLTARWREGLLKDSRYFLLALFCALPLVLGETKVAVFMVPIVGGILLWDDFLRAPLRYLPALVMVALLTVGLCYVYVVFIIHSNFTDVMAATNRYNFGSQGYSAGQYLNRTTVLSFWLHGQSWSDPMSFLIGNGLGSSYTAVDPAAVSGHLGQKFFKFGINLTAASTLLWDTGIIGLGLFTSMFIAAWFAARKLRRVVTDPAVRADALAIQAAIALFALYLNYSDSIVNLLSLELIYAVVLGYLAYLMKVHGLLAKSPTADQIPVPRPRIAPYQARRT
ncbi:MAG TPA: hypothetical protein VIF60_07585 [Burkholderiaceae bacterium]